jgi:CRISPR-associated exonuclease Cas4
MYSEDDFLPLSAVQHFLFCERQCALIHLEQIWSENVLTAEGRITHDRAHEEQFETRAGVRIERGLPLRSVQLGLNGKADVVEFHKTETGAWIPFPVEYKHGKPKENNCDKVQLCAQALCLEEMMNLHIPAGALYYGKTRRRLDVEFDSSLRSETIDTAHRLHEFIKQAKTPKAEYSKRCESCSLVDLCLPGISAEKHLVKEYVRKMVEEKDC